jgi:hypothetical protein
LLALAADTDDYDKNFVLTANIDLNPKRPGGRIFSAAVIAPDLDNSDFAFDGTFFAGVFDGAGYKIKNLVINTNGAGNDYLGLFGCSYGWIKNLNLEKISITAGSSSYGIGLLAGENSGFVSSCFSAGVIRANNYFGPAGGLVGNNYYDVNSSSSKAVIIADNNASYVGGLVGYNFQGTIHYCVSSGYIKNGNDSYDIGGLVGFNEDGTIQSSGSKTRVTVNQTSGSVGGLAGENTGMIGGCGSSGAVNAGSESENIGGLVGNNGGSISSCSSLSFVTAADSSSGIGGLVGYNFDDIVDCCSLGIVRGLDNSQYIGGLAGYSEGAVYDCRSSAKVTGSAESASIGGLVGENTGDVYNCLSTGPVTGLSSAYCVGGLVGNNFEGTISESYSAGAIAARNNSSQIGGLVGGNDSGSISSCYSAARVKGGNDSGSIGGFIGDNGGRIFGAFSIGTVAGAKGSYYVGGFAGYCGDGNISDCYSTAAVKSGKESDSVGGLIGDNESSLSNCYFAGIVKVGNNSYNVDALTGLNSGDIDNCYFLAASGPDNGNGQSLTDGQMKLQSSFFGWDFIGETGDGLQETWTSCDGIDYPKLVWNFFDKTPLKVAKCTITAGAKTGYDSIYVSGLMHAQACDFVSADTVNVKVYSRNNRNVEPHVFAFPVNYQTWKKGKFSSSIIDFSSKKTLAFDSKTLKFTFTAQNTDLLGLYSPMFVRVEIGNYSTAAFLDETIINGPKNLIPINFSMGIRDSLRIGSIQIKQATPFNQLIVTGEFSVENTEVDMPNVDFFVTLGQRIFMIPAYNFKPGTGIYSCSNVNLFDGAIASASFDFNKCTFSLTLSHHSIQNYAGLVDFGIEFGDFAVAQNIVIP